MRDINDQTRYRNTVLTAHVGWWGTAFLVTLRAIDAIPQQAGSLALLTLGLGVTSSLALSRMRLGKTITEVFQAGMKAAITLSANVFTDTCIMALDGRGVVVSVDHADAIGWENDEIVGRELRALLSPRSMGVRHIEPGTTITSPMMNQAGNTFDARLSVAVLGDKDREAGTLIVTVAPVVSSHIGYRLAGDEER
jgi:hypothetical protein